MSDDEVRTTQVDAVIELRDAAKRELDIRIIPWDTVITHQMGPEMFERGAFAGVDPRKVMLKAPDAEGGHRGAVAGRGIELQERDDGAYMTFKVSKVQAGDELLTLVADGVITGASVGFIEQPGGFSMQQRDGKRVRVQQRVALDHVITTWRPAYEHAAVVAMRDALPEEPETEVIPVSETTPEPVAQVPDAAFWAQFQERSESVNTRILERLDKIDERYRAEIIVPGGKSVTAAAPKLYDWANVAIRMLTGERISAQHIQSRALDDVLVTDNPGVVPDAFVNDVIGIMDPRRPFLSSTERIPTPDSGMSIVVPVLTQRSTAAVQGTEKTEIESTAMKVTTQDFPAITIAGGADVSIQLLKRSTPSTLDLLMRDLARAYALNADIQAVANLLNSGVTPGTGNLDPEALTIGEAWSNSIAAIGQAPDTIWLSSSAVANFIDAKNDGTNSPLYASLSTNFQVGNGAGGTLSALRPVYTPALDGSGADVLIGPSTGFAWAEDGTFTLAVDNPTLAGRDIAIVGILFFIARYPAAFTTYNISS